MPHSTMPGPSVSRLNSPGNHEAMRALDRNLGAIALARYLFTDTDGYACPRPAGVFYAEMEAEGYTPKEIFAARVHFGAKRRFRLGTKIEWIWPAKLMGGPAHWAPLPWTGQWGVCAGQPVRPPKLR
jgi:hypothetical protein